MPASPISASNTLRFETRARAAWLTLTRPQVMDSVSPRMLGELDMALDIIAGNGEFFTGT